MSGGNYVFCTGTGTNYDVRFPTDGAFNCSEDLDFGSLTDGTSNMMVLSETLVGTSNSPLDGSWRTVLPGQAMRQRYYGELDAGGPEDPDKVPDFAAIPANPNMESAFNAAPSEWLGNKANSWLLGRAIDTSYNGLFAAEFAISRRAVGRDGLVVSTEFSYRKCQCNLWRRQYPVRQQHHCGRSLA